MSEAPSLPAPRPLLLAVLAGGLAAHLLGAMLIESWMSAANAATLPQPAWTLAGYASSVSIVLTQLAFVGIPCVVLFAIAMAIAERREAKPLPAWLLAGLFATSPFALVLWIAMHMGDCFGKCAPVTAAAYLVPLLWIYGVGLLGATIAYGVRHWRWR
ncbi:hypothetical protein OF829_19185 [Sphingomonas sp. LB-2]|uniref:hypothetical protein n=1 Tax=Sphingomonas caeni TaxID=2984949 RepID=UPI002231F9B2|nr:hypothetical protein [Sphingomonas caeni]MCW3849369.1 hypothetical protein [Sphingomonas caeni]